MADKGDTPLHRLADEFDARIRALIEDTNLPRRMADAARAELLEAYDREVESERGWVVAQADSISAKIARLDAQSRRRATRRLAEVGLPPADSLSQLFLLLTGGRGTWEREADRHAHAFKSLLTKYMAAAVSDFLDTFYGLVALCAAQSNPDREWFVEELKRRLFGNSLQFFPFHDERGRKGYNVPFLFIKLNVALLFLKSRDKLTWATLAGRMNELYGTSLTAYGLRRAAANDGYTMNDVKALHQKLRNTGPLKRNSANRF